jgi:hypothetical protein
MEEFENQYLIKFGNQLDPQCWGYDSLLELFESLNDRIYVEYGTVTDAATAKAKECVKIGE